MIENHYHKIIQESVERHIDKTNSVYTDDLVKDTSFTRERVTRWLRKNGFEKRAGATSKRWSAIQ